jgi:CHAT domain-containing protein
MSLASEVDFAASREARLRALDLYEQAFNQADLAGEARLKARSLFSQATINYWHFGEWDLVRELASRAARLYEATGNKHLAANAMHLQAAAILEKIDLVEKTDSKGLSPEAQMLFNDALALFNEAHDELIQLGKEYDAALVTNNLGYAYHDKKGDLDTAANYYREAAGAFDELGEWDGKFVPSSNLATIDFDRGNLIPAVGWYQSTLDAWPPGINSEGRAHTLDNLAASQKALGRRDDALKSYALALEIHRQLDDLTGQGQSLTGIGKTYLDIGETDLALEYLETALKIRREANDGPGQVSALNAIGNIHRRNGDFDAALAAHRESYRLATALGDRAMTRQLIAEDQLAAGRALEALKTLEGDEQLAGELRNRKLLADNQYIHGEALLMVGDAENALQAYDSATITFKELGFNTEQSATVFGAARASRALGRNEEARNQAWQAIEQVEGLRSQLINPGMRAFFLAERQGYYTFLIDLLMSIHSASTDNDNKYLREALAVSERSRARALMDLVNETSIELTGRKGEELAAQQEMLYQKMAEARYRLNLLLADPPEDGLDESIAIIRQELAETENELNLLQIEYREASPDFVSMTDPRVLDTDKIQAQLDDDSALLQYSLGEPRSYLWLVTRNSVDGWPLPGSQEIESRARQLYELLGRPASSQASKAKLEETTRQFSQLILGSIEALPGQRLVVVADGVLQYLPFSILYGPGRKAKHETLITNHEIVYLPSTSVLAAQRVANVDRQATSKKIAIFADPVFEATDQRFAKQSAGTSAVNEVALQRSADRTDPNELKRLPATAREADAIASLVDPGDRILATGFDASRENVMNSGLNEFQLVHFATHGLIDSRYPALSALAFSRFDSQAQQRDGLLWLHDIYNLNLNADLVTLSACSTALGREIAGEGLNGLTQGLMHSGSKSVLASLWQVPDRATAELMRLFYQNLLEKEQKPAMALRNAQLELSSRVRWRDPYFWSAFVLQGDWQ